MLGRVGGGNQRSHLPSPPPRGPEPQRWHGSPGQGTSVPAATLLTRCGQANTWPCLGSSFPRNKG